MNKKERLPDNSGYQTEDQLKAQAKLQAEERAILESLKKPVPPRKKKAENFWYHYKWHTIGGGAALVLLAFFLKDMLFRTLPDATIIMATRSTYCDAATIEALSAAVEATATDFNKDGKVVVSIDYIHTPAQPTEEELAKLPQEQQVALRGGGQQDYANTMKLTTLVAAGIDPLFIVDDGMYDYFLQMSAGGFDQEGNPLPIPENAASMFTPLATVPGAQGDRLALSSTNVRDALATNADNLSFCLRAEQSMSDSKADYHAYCMELLQQLSSNMD